MPELPEVETVVRDLVASGLVGQTITRVSVLWPGTLRNVTPRQLQRRLRTRTISTIRRHGKYILICVDPDWLIIHLGMSGNLFFSHHRQPHSRVVLELSDRRYLVFRDPRKFGRIWLVPHPRDVIGRLGPDALDKNLSASAFAARLRNHRRSVKSLLLDQEIIAGVGNIYADESLWRARIHPLSQAADLSEHQLHELYAALRGVLHRAIHRRGTSLGEGQSNYRRPDGASGGYRRFLRVYQRTGEPCGRCGTPIKRFRLSQRSTHFCPHCQRQ